MDGNDVASGSEDVHAQQNTRSGRVATIPFFLLDDESLTENCVGSGGKVGRRCPFAGGEGEAGGRAALLRRLSAEQVLVALPPAFAEIARPE